MNSENKNDFKRLLHTMLPLVLAQLSLMGMNVMVATMSGHAGPVDLAGVSMGPVCSCRLLHPLQVFLQHLHR